MICIHKLTKVVKTNEHLMQVESIAECSLGAFCNTFDLHYAIIGLDKTNNLLFFVEWPLQVLLYTIKFNGNPI